MARLSALALMFIASISAAFGQLEWNLVNPWIVDLAYGNQTYVLLESRDWASTSSDLLNWRRHRLGTDLNPTSITFGAGIFVAVGNDPGGDLILRSTNGVDWVSQHPTGARSLGLVRYLNDQFVAVGGYATINGGFTVMLTSSDGISWREQFRTLDNFPPGPALLRVAYGNGEYVAMGGTYLGRGFSAQVFESADTRTWRKTFDLPSWMNDVVFGDGTFVSVGNSASCALAPNSTLTVRTNELNLNRVTWGKGVFVAASGIGIYNGAVYSSSDGISWEERVSETPMPVVSVSYLNDRFIAAGRGGIMSSEDGINWTVISEHKTYPFGGLAFGNRVFVATGGQKTLTSNNGVDWRITSVWTNVSSLGKAAYGAGKFIALGIPSTAPLAPRAILLTSPDGVNWHQPPLPTPFELTSLNFVNGEFIVAGAAGPIMTSSDGDDWTVRASDCCFWTSITFGNGTYLASKEYGSLVAAPALEGPWTPVSSPGPIGAKALVFGKGVFVAADGSWIWSSSDGISWTQRLSASGPVFYVGGVFVAGGDFAIAVSLDGANWSRATETFDFPWPEGFVGVAYGNDMFLGLGPNGETHTSPAVPFLQATGLRKDGAFALSLPATSPLTKVQVSSNLKEWTTITSVDAGTAASGPFVDPAAKDLPYRFYRLDASIP